jgi:genome maintenance exonuclease 1
MGSFKHKKLFDFKKLPYKNVDGRRMYESPSGIQLPSITSILGWFKKDSLKEWREKVGEEEANKISVHSLNNKEYTLKHMPSNLNLFRTIKPILDKNVELVYHQEVPLYSDKLRAAGRVDCVCKWNGKDAIVDFKTSSKPKKKEWIQDYFVQATAYSLMFEYVTTYHIPNIVICMAVENGEPLVFEDTIYPYVPTLLTKVEEYHAHFEDETIAHQIANAGA